MPCYHVPMQTLKSLFLIGLAGYAILLTLMYVFQRGLQYFPETVRTPPAQAGFPEAEEVILETTDGERLVAWHHPPQAGRPVVVYFHGNAGSLRLRADRFRRIVAGGNGLVGLSYRGYGGSTGTPGEEGMHLDAQAAWDFAAERHGAARIVLFGESMGTGVAVPLAAQRPVAGLILDAPFTSAVDIGAAAYPFVPVRLLMKDQFRSDLAAPKVTAPVLVLHGERDSVVPIAYGERLFALFTAPKEMVRFPDGGHVNLDNHGAARAYRRFLTDKVAATP